MEIEHVALNVEEPVAIAEWYVRHLGMTVARQDKEPPFVHFLKDSAGKVMIELYNNPADQVPDYRAMDPLLLHIAFASESPSQDKEKLVEAGATLVDDATLSDGSRIIMLRDPWGLAIQLCKRAAPML